MPAPAPIQHTASAGTTAYRLAVTTLVVAILTLGAAYGLPALFAQIEKQTEDPSLTQTHLVTIGAQHYVVPGALITQSAQRRDGFAERLDLRLALPLGAENALTEMDVALVPRGRARSSAVLLDSVYLHQFSDEQLSGPPGLVGKPLEDDAGTRGEAVWYDPLSANPFVAKCMAPVADGMRSCLRVFQLTDRNTAIVTFDPQVLGNWRQFDARVENALAGLRK